jgi:hypothetical protein
MFLSEPLQHQYGRRKVTGHMTEPTLHLHLVVYLLSSLYSTPVCWFRHMSCDLSPTILTLKWLRKEHSRSEDGIVLPKHVGAIVKEK